MIGYFHLKSELARNRNGSEKGYPCRKWDTMALWRALAQVARSLIIKERPPPSLYPFPSFFSHLFSSCPLNQQEGKKNTVRYPINRAVM